MIDVLRWYLSIQLVGLTVIPVAHYLFPRLVDRGYSVTKPIGMLILGYVSWILSVLHVVPNNRFLIFVILFSMAFAACWLILKQIREFKLFILREWKTIVICEVIFLVFFIGWTIYRGHDPAINHTEQPMDFAFLNASMRSYMGTPEDPWFRGNGISYYYFGYWMIGSLSKLSNVQAHISYNLAMALIPALAATAIFGLAYNLIRHSVISYRHVIIGGLSGVVLLGVAANLEGILEFINVNSLGTSWLWNWIRIDGLHSGVQSNSLNWTPTEYWWWFRATRVINTFQGIHGIDYTIQEFPFFSFLLGDLHPHVISIPFVILFITVCWNFLQSPNISWRKDKTRNYSSIMVLGFILGGLGFTNLWDLPIFSVLFLAILGLKTYQLPNFDFVTLLRNTLSVGVVVIGLALLMFLPYYLNFNGSLTGIYVVETATTRPIHTFIVWGTFLVLIGPFVLVSFWKTKVPETWRTFSAIALLVGFFPYVIWAFWTLQTSGTINSVVTRFFHVLPYATLIVMATYNVLWFAHERKPTSHVFIMVLTTLGLILVMGPELFFIGDVFSNRMNTIFKMYYQAWIIFAIVGGFIIYYWNYHHSHLSGSKRVISIIWAVLFIILLSGSMYYPPAAISSKSGPPLKNFTLDGLAFITENHQDEYEAIEYLKNNLDHKAGLLEAAGSDYSEFGRISSSTGISTIVNWTGHQTQWRGTNINTITRTNDVAEIYQGSEIDNTKNILEKYNIDYVYVGPRERLKYGDKEFKKFQEFMEPIFENDNVIIYHVRQ